MFRYFLLFLWLPINAFAQIGFEQKIKSMPVINLAHGVKITLDEPLISTKRPTKIIIYALPNGNTNTQTFGKKIAQTDDWHFDIQHIGAQTEFIRNTDHNTNYIVAYLENELKSWPMWRRKTINADSVILQIVNNLSKKYSLLKPKVVLSAHSGGGSFIFGLLNAQTEIPKYIERIIFLDATYGYEPNLHHLKIKHWLAKSRKFLQVIAYNDSVVVYNGKPLVSATGGTWYRSKLFANNLGNLHFSESDERLSWANKTASTAFILLKNPEAKIFHTVLVERNGLIHATFSGTKFAEKGYLFWGERAYDKYILK